MNIAVFCSSSGALDDKYYDLARRFGEKLAQEGHVLVYGGANVGMMKVLAQSTKQNGGKLIGVIPDFFDKKGLTCDVLDDVYYVDSMAERKQKIVDLSGAFVALPGGFGTLDELLEVIVLKQIAQIDKPVVIVNYQGFYDKLIEQFDWIYRLNFAKPQYRDIYFVARDVDEVFEYLKDYKPAVDDDWHKVSREDFRA